jgi:hypothetical protein
MARQWTSEQRARQSELIRQWKPWEKSTGAKTPEGKAIAARNAFRGGWRNELREFREAIAALEQFRRKVAC